MQTVPYMSYILFISGILIYILTLLLINGKLFPLYSNNDYPYEEYVKFWKNMTSEQRLTLSQTYYQFFTYFKEKIDEIDKNKNNTNIEFEKVFTYSDYYRKEGKYSILPFIRVSLIPKAKNYTKRLLICSHFDGHNLTGGGTAYDDAIHVVSMLGTIDSLTKKDIKLNTRVDFLFDGAEEYGLIGAYQYVNNLTEKLDYDYLNLEAMGGSPPYGFVIKSINGNYRVQKALSKSRGSILVPSNYIYVTNFTTSSTDHVVFDKQGWKGGVSVFLGKGSVYHTKYDRIEEGNEYHLKIAGNQLLDFVLNYEVEGYNDNSVGYGIAPICMVVPIIVMYPLIPLIFIFSVVVIIIKEKNNVKEFLKDILKEFLCFIIILAIFILQGLLISLINPNSASANQVFVGLTAMSGFFLFLFFQKIFRIQKWSRLRAIFDLLIMMICITTDLSLPFLCLSILSIIFYTFNNKFVKFIFGILQYLLMSLFFAFSIQVFMQYTTRFKEIIGNIILFILFFVFSYHLSASPLEFNDITEEEDISQMINDILKKSNSNEDKQYLKKDIDYNINDEIKEDNDDEPKYNNKYCNKKTIPIYLMIIYLLYPIILLVVLFLKPYPYSKDYTVRGKFLNVFKENKNTSSMIFTFGNGYNYVKKNIKESDIFKNNIKEIENITEIVKMGYSGKCFSYESTDKNIGIFNDKCRNISMPDGNVFNITPLQSSMNGTYDFNFNFNISNDYCIDFAYIYIRCTDCVKKINNITIDTKKDDNPIHDVYLRVGKYNITNDDLPNFITNSNFTLTTNNFNYTIILNTMQITRDYYKFLDAFGEGACNSKSLSLITDTIFVYDRSYQT